MSIMRPLRCSDFKNKYDYITATYVGNSHYLTQGKQYVVTPTDRPGLVTVQLSYNRDRLKRSNGGVRFSIHTFLIEEEEPEVIIKLSDLSPEERESLMRQAREEIEQENIAKDAVAMYAMKKKELTNNTVSELVQTLGLKNGPQASKCRDRFVHMTNYLYALNRPATNKNGSNVAKILTAEDWTLFQEICKKVHECMVHSVKYDNICKK